MEVEVVSYALRPQKVMTLAHNRFAAMDPRVQDPQNASWSKLSEDQNLIF